MHESQSIQPKLPLPFPDLANDLPLLPARMVNEYQYCPGLAYLSSREHHSDGICFRIPEGTMAAFPLESH